MLLRLRDVALALGLTAAFLADPIRAQAQEVSAGSSGEIQDPAMARPPRQFKISTFLGALLWGTEEDRPDVDDAAIVGLEIERQVGHYIAFRLSGGYGRTTLTENTAAVDVNQFLIDLAVVPRLALGPLRRAGVIPFGTVGIGTLVHDPEDDELVTKSQSALELGGGIDVDFSKRFGGRVEWRHYMVDSENIFEPTDRSGVTRTVERLSASLYWKF